MVMAIGFSYVKEEVVGTVIGDMVIPPGQLLFEDSQETRVVLVLILASNEVDRDAREDYGKCLRLMKVRSSLIKIDIPNRLASLVFLGQKNILLPCWLRLKKKPMMSIHSRSIVPQG